MRVVVVAVVGLLPGGCVGLPNLIGNHGGGGLSAGGVRGAFATQNDTVVFVLLADGCNGGGAAAFPGRNSGELHAKDGRDIPWSCRTRDGRSGRATIDGVDYDLANGCVFLVSTRAKQTSVRQLHRDTSGVTHAGVERAISEWAEVDPAIREFVTVAEEQ